MKTYTESNEPSTSVSLLERVQHGDGDAWKMLAQVYGPVVYGWARRAGCQSADAADVMQETFVAVSRAIGGFDHEIVDATFRGWLWTITRNKIRDQARRRATRQAAGDDAVGGTAALIAMSELPVPSAPADPQTDLSVSDLPPGDEKTEMAIVRRRMIEFLRQKFEPRTWQMFWETAVIGRDPDDVAAEMDVSRWAVYKARARVLHRLRSELAGLSNPSVEPDVRTCR